MRYGSIISLAAISLSFASLASTALAAEDNGRAPIPSIPAPPHFDKTAYPSCRKSALQANDRLSQFAAVQSCLNELERFNRFHMMPFTRQMNDFAQSLLISDKNYKNSSASLELKRKYNALINSEVLKCVSMSDTRDPGEYYADYAEIVQEYWDDEAVLKAIKDHLIYDQ